MKVHSQAESWCFDGKTPEFLHTHIIFQNVNEFYHIYINQREHTIDLNTIDNSQLLQIPRQHIFPPFESRFTICESAAMDSAYIKQPRLTGYKGSDHISALVRQEAIVCGTLKENPHPNIARYLGCLKHHDRIVGLCFERYAETLRQRRERGIEIRETEDIIKQVEAGIAHLHLLGLVHNDLSPDNIMFCNTNQQAVVIIDFDSCVSVGSPLPDKRGDVPEGISIATPENDYLGIQRIRQFICTE